MRKTVLFLIAGAFATVSCTKEISKELQSGEEVCLSASLDESRMSRTALGEGGTVCWSEGDDLAVFTSSTSASTNKGVFTLCSGAGTSTASFSGTLGSGDGPYYAIFPNGDKNQKGSGLNFFIDAIQTYAQGSFSKKSAIMCASFSSLSDKIQFNNVCGAIRLQFTGTDKISKIVLTDRSGMKLNGRFFLSIADAGTDKQNLKKNGDDGDATVTIDCPTPVQLGTEPVAFHAVVPPGAFASGLDIAVYGEGGALLKKFSTATAHCVVRNHIKVIAPIAIDSTIDDLSVGEKANCYIVKKGGKYKFKAVKGNTSETLTGTGAELLWESNGTTTAPAAGSIVGNVNLKDGYIEFGASGEPGNALIALKNGDTIVWSWHIWVPATKISAATYSNASSGGVMDRNLGALSAEAGSALSNGLLYQWGRKDPFPGAASYSSKNEPQAFTSPMLSEQTSSATTVEYATARPTTFFFCPGSVQSSGDWVYGGNVTNWGDEKTIYDPCPPGYRVASSTCWDGLTGAGDASTFSVSVDGKHSYPFNGLRWNSDASLHGPSSTGQIWSAYAKNNSGYFLKLEASGFTAKKTAPRAQAMGVRCFTSTTPIVGKDEKKVFQDLPEGTLLSSIDSTAGGYKLTFSNGFTYDLMTSKTGLVRVSDDEYWVVNGVKSAYKHVALEYMTVGSDGFWYKNGLKTAKRATPENLEASEEDIVLTNVVEKARKISIRFSDGVSMEFEKAIDWGMYVVKTAKEMNIYIGHNNSSNWTRFRFIYRYKEYHGGTVYPDYLDNWGLSTPYSCTHNSGSSFTDKEVLFLNGEAEAAVQTPEYGNPDKNNYSGGTLHGWENMALTPSGSRDFKIEVDSKEVSETGTFSIKAASKVEIWQKTKIAQAFSPVGTEYAYADVSKHWVIENGTVKVEVRYDFLKSIAIAQAKFGMFCVKRLVTEKDTASGYVTNMVIKDNVPGTVYSVVEGWESGVPASKVLISKDRATSRVEQYGERGVSFAMSYAGGNMKSGGGFHVQTNGNNYNKIYCDICGKYTPAVGESLYDTIVWEIDYIPDYDLF